MMGAAALTGSQNNKIYVSHTLSFLHVAVILKHIGSDWW